MEKIFIHYVIRRGNEDGKARTFSKEGSTEGRSDFWPKISSCQFYSTLSDDTVNEVDI